MKSNLESVKIASKSPLIISGAYLGASDSLRKIKTGFYKPKNVISGKKRLFSPHRNPYCSKRLHFGVFRAKNLKIAKIAPKSSL